MKTLQTRQGRDCHFCLMNKATEKGEAARYSPRLVLPTPEGPDAGPQPCPMERKGCGRSDILGGLSRAKPPSSPPTHAPIPIQVAGRSTPGGSCPLGDPWEQTPLTPAHLEDRNKSSLASSRKRACFCHPRAGPSGEEPLAFPCPTLPVRPSDPTVRES